MNKHLQNYLILLVGQVIAIPLVMTQTVLIGRILGPSGMGFYAMVTAAAMLCFSLSLTWTQSAILRYGAVEWERNGSLEEIWSGRVPFILLGIMLTFFMLFFQPLEWLSRLYHIQSNWWTLIFCYTISLWLVSEVKALTQITGDFILSVFISLFASISFIGVLIYYILTPGEERVEQVLIPVIAINIIIFGGCWIGITHKTRYDFFRISFSQASKVFVYSWPMLFSIFSSYAADWGNQIIIQSQGSIDNVGLYTTAQIVTFGFIGVAGPISTIIQPMLISKNSSNQFTVREYLEKAVPTITFLWLFITIPFMTLLPYLFKPLFGERFLGAIPLVAVFTAALPGAIIGSLYSGLFFLQNRLFWLVFYNVIMTLANLCGSYLLVPYFGFISAAVCLSLSYLGTQMLYYFDQHQRTATQSSKMNSLFALILMFSVPAIFFCESMNLRLLYFSVGYIALILFVRSRRIVDDSVISMLFSGKLAFLLPIVRKLLIPADFSVARS